MSDSTVFSDTFYLFGTNCDVVLPGMTAERAQKVTQRIKTVLEELESQVSRKHLFSFVRDTDLKAAGEWMEAPGEFMDLLSLCSDFYQMSNGAFDVTIGALNHLWASNENAGDDEIRDAVARCGFENLEIDTEGGRFRFLKTGMMLDFGSIEKAWALDLLKAILKEEKVQRCIVSFEEESVLAIGKHPSGEAWPIGIRNYLDPNDFLHVFEVSDKACCTAGTVFIRDDGQGLQQRTIISPESGMPVEEKKAVVVCSESATLGAFVAHVWLILPENDRSILADQLKNIEIFESEYLDDDVRTRLSILNGTNDED